MCGVGYVLMFHVTTASVYSGQLMALAQTSDMQKLQVWAKSTVYTSYAAACVHFSSWRKGEDLRT